MRTYTDNHSIPWHCVVCCLLPQNNLNIFVTQGEGGTQPLTLFHTFIWYHFYRRCASSFEDHSLQNGTHLQFYLKCYYDQILDIQFFTFSHTIGVSKISCQISIYYEQQNSCFLNLSFREFTATINFPCSKSGLRIGENDVIFSKIPHGLKL